MDYIPPPPRTLNFAFTQHFRVIHALMLRDIKTRMGASYFGFLLGLILPLGHIGVLLIVYSLLGRRTPIGTDVLIYLTTAILPFVVWSYTHQKVMHAFSQNRALTAFPIVKFTDILISRALVELLNSTLIVIIVFVSLTALGRDLLIQNPPAVFYTIILAYVFGVSTGFAFGIVTQLVPMFIMLGFLFVPLTWVTCGVFFIPGGLPEQIRTGLSIFPMSHLVDFGRSAYYGEYISEYHNLLYVGIMIILNFTIGLAVDRLLRPQITAK